MNLSIPGKLKSRLSMCRYVDHPYAFLVRESSTQVIKRFRPIELAGIYTYRDTEFRLVHGSDDVYIFQEIFHDQFYAFPDEVAAVLPDGPLRVLDLGGNVGLFGAWIHATRPGSSLTAIEADPANAARYREFVKFNQLEWSVVAGFAGNVDGSVHFNAEGKSTSMKTEDGSGIKIPSLDVFPMLEGLDFLKMDIEGGEWDVLTDPRFIHNPVPVLALEYHPEFCPGKSARVDAERLLLRAGYQTLQIMTFGEVGMLWAYRN